MDQRKIGEYISYKRKKKELTQAALAEKIGVSDKSVSKWERGICLPDVSKYIDLCEILGISINELFAGEDLETNKIIEKSENNIINIAKYGSDKNKKLFKIIICLFVCIAVLVTGLGWTLSRDNTLRGNYITAFSIENPEEADLVSTFGNAKIFKYSLKDEFKSIEYEIVKYRNGKIVDVFKDRIGLLFENEREKVEMVGIQDISGSNKFMFTATFEGGSASFDIPYFLNEEEKYMGYMYTEISNPQKLELNKKIPIYARLASNKGFSDYSLEKYMENPEKNFRNIDCAMVVYIIFK